MLTSDTPVPDGDLPTAGKVVALLGATNTGKTHHAIERMLERPSGMLGLPLRLLAREVYERVTGRVGEQAVALVTGEEKRVPPAPRYWVCTVEAMPRDVPVDFMAVDEVQLMGHPERGHVFTERALEWRGTGETWLLGSTTAEPLLRAMISDLQVQRRPRLSQLTHLGRRSLRSLPRRSAVVTFTAAEVYRLAEILRRRKGGAAVVLGALSPRARNAQVALYESGEVDYLVATDAIGMGLNLDIDHVGLASLEKFDGFEHRPLDAAELGQIVGRAGRYTRDGTFGTVAPLPDLAPGLVRALEGHRFPPLDFAYYRTRDLCFDSVEGLLASLGERPPPGPFRRPPDSDDVLVLQALRRDREVMRRVENRERVQLLWDVCHIPNYESHIPEHHGQILAQIFVQLVDQGAIDAPWLRARLRRLQRASGSLEELTARVAAARTWSYVANQGGWLTRARGLREHALAVEEELSDALHERLVERFVASQGAGRGAGGGMARASRGAIASGPFAKLLEHQLYVDPEREKEQSRQRWVERLVQAPHQSFELDAHGGVHFEGQRVAQLLAGPEPSKPGLRAQPPEWAGGGMRRRLERRLSAFVLDIPEPLLGPLRGDEVSNPALRGLLYQLRAGLGNAPRAAAREQLALLEAEDEALLKQRGIVLGRRTVLAMSAFELHALRLRRLLCLVAGELPGEPAWPVGAVSAPRSGAIRRESYLRMGYWVSGAHVIRCDRLEDVLERLSRPAEEMGELASLLETDEASATRIVASLRRRKRRRRKRSR